MREKGKKTRRNERLLPLERGACFVLLSSHGFYRRRRRSSNVHRGIGQSSLVMKLRHGSPGGDGGDGGGGGGFGPGGGGFGCGAGGEGAQVPNTAVAVTKGCGCISWMVL